MKRLIIFTICCSMLVCFGCSQDNTGADTSVSMPQTSANMERARFNESQIRTPEEHEDGYTYVTVAIRPQFVLHIDSKGIVDELEALNSDADTLSAETSKQWQDVSYEDAFSAIIEQCIIDGYISDNNPDIELTITGPQMNNIRSAIRSSLEELASVHGLDVNISINGDNDDQ